MRITINKDITIPIYIQIFQQVKQQILSGELLPGFRLPSERKLSESLAVNRSTVLNAYRELKSEGLVGSHVGNGTVVLASVEEEVNLIDSTSQGPIWSHVFNENSSKADSYLVKDLMVLSSRNDVISFATGIASPTTSPIQALEGIEEELVIKKNYRALLHTPTEGFNSLRETVCGLMHKKGVYCQCDEVIMLSGSQQGIDLIARILIDPGDIVIVEEPSFFPAIQAFRAMGARIIGVPIDSNGMKIDVLEQLLQRYMPKLIYTIPTFQNPSGTEMSLERRKQLLEIAYKYKVIIIEDDAYGDLCYEEKALPLLKSMDNSGYVIYLNTFSKNIYSGLRIGWMVAHKKVIKKFAATKQIMDLHSSSLSQWIVERFIKSGAFEPHINKICEEYKLRRDTMYYALSKYAPKGMTWNKPRGGYYIWCKLPNGVSASKLISKVEEYKVTFVPGNAFFTTGQGDNFIRLCFTFAAFDEIDEGIKKLCNAIRDLVSNKELVENIEIVPLV